MARTKREKKKPLVMSDFFRHDNYLMMEEIGRQLDEVDVEWDAKRLFSAIKLEFKRYYKKFGEEHVEIDPDCVPWTSEEPRWRPMLYSGKKRRRKAR